MKQWLQVRESNLLPEILGNPRAVNYWRKMFKMAYEEKKSTWAYQWLYSCWTQKKVNIIPQVNLISNLGFSTDATNTNTTVKDNIYADMEIDAITFPLRHPSQIEVNTSADRFTQDTFFSPSLLTKGRAKINRTLGIRSI